MYDPQREYCSWLPEQSFLHRKVHQATENFPSSQDQVRLSLSWLQLRLLLLLWSLSYYLTCVSVFGQLSSPELAAGWLTHLGHIIQSGWQFKCSGFPVLCHRFSKVHSVSGTVEPLRISCVFSCVILPWLSQSELSPCSGSSLLGSLPTVSHSALSSAQHSPSAQELQSLN